MADTYTLQYPGERVDQDLERAERATVDLTLAATLGGRGSGLPAGRHYGGFRGQ